MTVPRPQVWRAGTGSFWPPGPVLGLLSPREGPVRPGRPLPSPPGTIDATAPELFVSPGPGVGRLGGAPVVRPPCSSHKCPSYLSQASLDPALFVLTLGGVYLLFSVCQQNLRHCGGVSRGFWGPQGGWGTHSSLWAHRGHTAGTPAQLGLAQGAGPSVLAAQPGAAGPGPPLAWSGLRLNPGTWSCALGPQSLLFVLQREFPGTTCPPRSSSGGLFAARAGRGLGAAVQVPASPGPRPRRGAPEPSGPQPPPARRLSQSRGARTWQVSPEV